MSDLRALSGLFAVVAIFAATMAVLTALVTSGRGGYLVPSPETTVKQFLGALKAHRYGTARDQLSEGARARVTEEQLRALVISLERSRGGISMVRIVGTRAEGAAATVDVRVVMGDRTEEGMSFPLAKERGLWKIDSVEPLSRHLQFVPTPPVGKVYWGRRYLLGAGLDSAV